MPRCFQTSCFSHTLLLHLWRRLNSNTWSSEWDFEEESADKLKAAYGEERMNGTENIVYVSSSTRKGIRLYSIVAATCPHFIMLWHVIRVKWALWQLDALLLFSNDVMAAWCFCLCSHVCLHICVGRGSEGGGEGGTERRTLTSLSTPEADSSVYHASAAAHLGTISLMFAYFLFRPPGRGVGPRGVTVCAKRFITGSLGCQKVMSTLSWITIQHKSWWTESFSDWPQHKDEMKTFGPFREWLPSCTSF